MRKVLVILFFLLALPFIGAAQGSAQQPKPDMVILFSSNVQGEVEPCG